MKIAIIGTGNVGSALAEGWVKAGHQIYLGVRNTNDFKGKYLCKFEHVFVLPIEEAVSLAEVVLLAVPPKAIPEVAARLKKFSGKTFIDSTNGFPTPPEGFTSSFEAWEAGLSSPQVVKAFNNTGYENMRHPVGLDTFMASNSQQAKKITSQLAVDIGFNRPYDFGAADKAGLLEQLAICWINLAYFQGLGTHFGFNVIQR